MGVLTGWNNFRCSRCRHELVKLPRTEMVYVALLSRDQIVHDYRHEALMGLADLHGSDMLTELVAAIERADGNDTPAGTAV